MRLAPSSLAALILFAAAGIAQEAPDLRVQGTVIDAETGQPLENVKLSVCAGGPYCARPEGVGSTGADGGFRITLKTGGLHVFRIWHDGYVADYSQTVAQCSPCTVAFRLHAEAKFRGRVVAADTKEAMSHVIVEAIRVEDDFEIARSRTIASDVTDRNGNFSLTQLTAGQYFFRFTPPSPPASLIAPDPHDLQMERFVVQWWPGGNTYKGSTPFTVLAGTVFTMPDMWIPPAASFQVSGIVQPEACQAGDAYTVSIGVQAGAEPFRSMMVRCGANYVFQDLKPGRYQIRLLRKDQEEAGLHEEVVVTDGNLQRDLPPRAGYTTP